MEQGISRCVLSVIIYHLKCTSRCSHITCNCNYCTQSRSAWVFLLRCCSCPAQGCYLQWQQSVKKITINTKTKNWRSSVIQWFELFKLGSLHCSQWLIDMCQCNTCFCPALKFCLRSISTLSHCSDISDSMSSLVLRNILGIGLLLNNNQYYAAAAGRIPFRGTEAVTDLL